MNAAEFERMQLLNTSLGLTIEASRVPMLHMFRLIGCPFVLRLSTAKTSLSYVASSSAITLKTSSGDLIFSVL